MLQWVPHITHMDQIPRTVKKLLEELGCNNSEIIIINHLLGEGSITLRGLCKIMGKSTGVLSEALKKLIAKGIVKREMLNGSPSYLIENPETILRWVTRETERNIAVLKQKKQDFEQFSQTLVTNSAKPKIKFFTGMDGLKESYYEILKYEPRELLSYISITHSYQAGVLDLLEDFVQKRAENGISVRIIARKSPMSMYLKMRDSMELRKTRIVSGKQFPTVNSEVNLFGDCMHSMSLDPQGIFAFIVEDKHMVNIQKAAFELAWRESEHENAAIEKELQNVKNPKIFLKQMKELEEQTD